MGIEIIEGVYHQPLKIINTTGGSVMHAIKGFDDGFKEFGECYFSTAQSMMPKAWKKHTEMTCNLFVPVGEVKFVFYDDRPYSKSFRKVAEFTLGQHNYGRLIIYPGIWFGFSGIAEGMDSLILNVSSLKHDPAEGIRLEPGSAVIPYNWNFSV